MRRMDIWTVGQTNQEMDGETNGQTVTQRDARTRSLAPCTKRTRVQRHPNSRRHSSHRHLGSSMLFPPKGAGPLGATAASGAGPEKTQHEPGTSFQTTKQSSAPKTANGHESQKKWFPPAEGESGHEVKSSNSLHTTHRAEEAGRAQRNAGGGAGTRRSLGRWTLGASKHPLRRKGRRSSLTLGSPAGCRPK